MRRRETASMHRYSGVGITSTRLQHFLSTAMRQRKELFEFFNEQLVKRREEKEKKRKREKRESGSLRKQFGLSE